MGEARSQGRKARSPGMPVHKLRSSLRWFNRLFQAPGRSGDHDPRNCAIHVHAVHIMNLIRVFSRDLEGVRVLVWQGWRRCERLRVGLDLMGNSCGLHPATLAQAAAMIATTPERCHLSARRANVRTLTLEPPAACAPRIAGSQTRFLHWLTSAACRRPRRLPNGAKRS